jgi:hypothetical protein
MTTKAGKREDKRKNAIRIGALVVAGVMVVTVVLAALLSGVAW